jgi:uncharacterized RDD family membrane protein YckC
VIPGAGREQAPLRWRWRACLWDYLAITGWLLALTAIGVPARRWLPTASADPSPLLVDAIAFTISVLPVWAYLTATEAGPRQGTWGKRRTHLRVVTTEGSRPRLSRIAIRNGVKLLPWQLAHVSVARIITGVDAPATIAITYALSLFIPAVSIVMAWRDPRQRRHHRSGVDGTLTGGIRPRPADRRGPRSRPGRTNRHAPRSDAPSPSARCRAR